MRWQFEQELLPPGEGEDDRFGEKVLIDRDFIAVSGLEQTHLYRRGREGEARWVLCQSLSRPEDLRDGVFGDPYGLGGGYLVAGSRRTTRIFWVCPMKSTNSRGQISIKVLRVRLLRRFFGP